MTTVGVCVNARHAMPERAELDALGLGAVRIFGYDLVELERAVRTSRGRRVLLTINNELAQVGHDWQGLPAVCERIAGWTGVWGVEVNNELDLWHHEPPVGLPDPRLTPWFAAQLVRRVSPILRAGGKKVILPSVASREWIDYLAALAREAGGAADYACLHPYGSRIGDVPAHDWPQLAGKVQVAASVSGLPVVLSEAGIKVSDAGGEQAHAAWCRRFVEWAQQAPEGLCPLACLFAWHDGVGRADEQGLDGFGLRDGAGVRRPAWEAVQRALGGPIARSERMLPREALEDLFYGAGVKRAAVPFDLDVFGIQKAWAEDPFRYGSCLGPERPDPNGGVVQMFARGAIRWDDGFGAREA